MTGSHRQPHCHVMQEVMASLGVATVGELAAVPMSKLVAQLGQETAAWLARLAQVRVPLYESACVGVSTK